MEGVWNIWRWHDQKATCFATSFLHICIYIYPYIIYNIYCVYCIIQICLRYPFKIVLTYSLSNRISIPPTSPYPPQTTSSTGPSAGSENGSQSAMAPRWSSPTGAKIAIDVGWMVLCHTIICPKSANKNSQWLNAIIMQTNLGYLGIVSISKAGDFSEELLLAKSMSVGVGVHCQSPEHSKFNQRISSSIPHTCTVKFDLGIRLFELGSITSTWRWIVQRDWSMDCSYCHGNFIKLLGL